MGQGTSKAQHVFLAGLDGAGKTKYLYSNLLDISAEDFEPSEGFNCERVYGSIERIQIWEAGGGKYIRKFWNTIIEIIPFRAVIFIVNTYEPHRLIEAKEELHNLIY
mmetsp:Transcript_32526/g.28798  ORF Transcript_32526/g.28798 Transcript_32526/m.28798 type:complete len:107 (+) Transcript_32526:2-322(+)